MLDLKIETVPKASNQRCWRMTVIKSSDCLVTGLKLQEE